MNVDLEGLGSAWILEETDGEKISQTSDMYLQLRSLAEKTWSDDARLHAQKSVNYESVLVLG